jgi:hypothetical protein
MNLTLASYLVPAAFHRFQWHRFSGQGDSPVTYVYLGTPPVGRLQGDSSVLYVGKTEQPIDQRFAQATRTKNTPANSQSTNIRSSHIMRLLTQRGDQIELYFTLGLWVNLSAIQARDFGQVLQIWNKSHFLKFFPPSIGGTVDVSIEKYLLGHYMNEHLEVPPLNNSG